MKKSTFFWVSFSDLMTSLFFLMLVLSSISFVLFERERGELISTISTLDSLLAYNEANDSIMRIAAEKYRIIESVEQNLEPLKNDADLFIYEPRYKRYRLAFDIQFNTGRVGINANDVSNFTQSRQKIDNVGRKLKSTVDLMIQRKKQEPEKYKNISYLIVISGSASKLPGDNVNDNYIYSYNRAYNLYKYWRDVLGIDFDAEKYHDFIEFQIAGNGEGGIGRFERDPYNNYLNEKKNQRFLINIIPKIGEL